MPKAKANNTNDNELTAIELAFVDAFLGSDPGIRLNISRSYMAAKRIDLGSRPDQAVRLKAKEIYHRPRVQSRISQIREERSNFYEASIERVLQELAAIAFSDLRDYGFWKNDAFTLFDSEDIPDELAGVISAIKRVGKLGIELKLWPKTEALKILAKYHGMDNDFNTARRVLRSYGIAMVEDPSTELGWRIEAVKQT